MRSGRLARPHLLRQGCSLLSLVASPCCIAFGQASLALHSLTSPGQQQRPGFTCLARAVARLCWPCCPCLGNCRASITLPGHQPGFIRLIQAAAGLYTPCQGSGRASLASFGQRPVFTRFAWAAAGLHLHWPACH